MPVAHQIILGIIVAGFVVYPIGLFFGWIATKGWETMDKFPNQMDPTGL